ncbi:MAG: fibronectin type III domain-containing protein, partial [Desulfobulbales bacterium]|nr:fibronectin type III domain-containing protein [Desulfobulbales bacterium]
VSALLLISLLPGCGKKTALVPPRKLVPVAVNDLHYTLDEEGVTLKWSYPTKMENSDVLQTITGFEVVRAVIPAGEFCQGCPVQYEEPVEIEGGRLPEPGKTRTASFRETYLQSGYRYFYKIRSRSGGLYASRDSNVVSFTWNDPPKAPKELHLESGDKAITLSWEPVRVNIKETPLAQEPVYQVYRKNAASDFAAVGRPVQEPAFKDLELENNKTYFYRVRAGLVSAGSLQTGPASLVVSGMPRDLTPPGQPRHLVAVKIPAGIKLVWQAVGGEDLAGYRIYRREDENGVPGLIAEVGPDRNQYIDEAVTYGRKWFYAVTAFDTARPGNESLPAEEVFVDLR